MEATAVKHLIKNFNLPICIWNMDLNVNYSKNFSNTTSLNLSEKTAQSEAYVFLVKDHDELMEYLNKRQSVEVLWNVEAVYLIIFKKTSYLDNRQIWKRVVRELLQKLWKDYAILKVFVTRFVLYMDIESRVLTYNPFIKTNKKVMGKLCSWKMDDREPVNCGKFRNKLEDMHRYPLKVDFFSVNITAEYVGTTNVSKTTSRSFYGRDAMVLQTLETVMNFTAVIQQPRGNELLGYESNGTVNGALGDLTEGRSDVAMNGRYVQAHEIKAFKFLSLGFDMDHVCVIVPKGSDIPPYLVFMKCFGFKVWCSFAMSYIVSHITWFLIMKALEFRSHTLTALVDTLTIFMSMPLAWFTKMPYSSQRILVSSWILSSIVSMNIFQCTLIEVVTKHSAYPDIDTLQELDKSDLSIAANQEMLFTFYQTGNLLMDRLHKKVFLANDSTVSQVGVDNNVAFLESCKNAAVLLEIYNKLHKILHIVSESPRTYLISYAIPRISPYEQEFNKHIMAMKESGILKKWHRDGYYKHTLPLKLKYSFSKKIFQPLVLSDIQVPLVFWLFSVIMSSVVFLLECGSNAVVHN
ncbi:hypothetical protein PR048_010625 [Dryococelus australis]|uniref:Uncharacterized protein n=1 Tax=Dryococelus australis TaxID=614101 RepID=A0ABQ9I4E2_9NEOP|nr:hypothetical protein PR048_010625 [Dryococelus australis]